MSRLRGYLPSRSVRPAEAVSLFPTSVPPKSHSCVGQERDQGKDPVLWVVYGDGSGGDRFHGRGKVSKRWVLFTVPGFRGLMGRVERFDVIIVDTSGRHKQESELFEEMVNISNAVKPVSLILSPAYLLWLK